MALVTVRYVLVPKTIISRNPDKLVEFQVAEYINPWALKNNLRAPKRIPLYSLVTVSNVEHFRFPRFCLTALLSSYTISTLTYQRLTTFHHSFTQPLTLRPDFAPTPVQALILDYLFTHIYITDKIRDCASSCTVALDPGLGKTKLALQAFVRFQTLVPQSSLLYITVNNPLVTQVLGDISQTIDGTPSIAVTATQWCNICVLNIDKAIAITDRSFFNCFNFVVFDEVPCFCTPARRIIFQLAKSTACLGLTAEPYSRSDQLDPIFHAHLGPLIDDSLYDRDKHAPNAANGIPVELRTHVYACRDPTLCKPHRNSALGTVDFLGSLKACLVNDPTRTDLIINVSLQLVERHRHYIFAQHVDFAIAIHRRLVGLLPARKITLLISDTGSLVDLRAQLETSDIVVSSYGMGTFGLSLPSMTALITAEPPYNVRFTQLRGRITRLVPGDDLANTRLREFHYIVDSKQWWLRSHHERMCARFNVDMPSQHRGPDEHEQLADMSFGDIESVV